MPTQDFNLEDRSPFTRRVVQAKGARLPDLEVRLLDGVTPVDLSTATITFSMEDEAGVLKVVNQPAAFVNTGTDGKVKYVWAAADVDTTGLFKGQFKITKAGKDYLIPDNLDQVLLIEISSDVS